MPANSRYLGLKKSTILASDSWKSTIPASAEFSKQKGCISRRGHREMVAHSVGEANNPNSFTTNGIEAARPVVKR
eukprot:5915262-Lingulodinium_polyedra.AAC.1